MKLCPCGAPTGRGPRARLCLACVRDRDRACVRVYMRSPRGRSVRLRYSRSPRGKIMFALWKDAHPESVARSNARRKPRPNAIGTTIRCQTELCEGTWVRTRHNGSRKFCVECQGAFGLRNSYRTRDLRERGFYLSRFAPADHDRELNRWYSEDRRRRLREQGAA